MIMYRSCSFSVQPNVLCNVIEQVAKTHKFRSKYLHEHGNQQNEKKTHTPMISKEENHRKLCSILIAYAQATIQGMSSIWIRSLIIYSLRCCFWEQQPCDCAVAFCFDLNQLCAVCLLHRQTFRKPDQMWEEQKHSTQKNTHPYLMWYIAFSWHNRLFRWNVYASNDMTQHFECFDSATSTMHEIVRPWEWGN